MNLVCEKNIKNIPTQLKLQKMQYTTVWKYDFSE